MAISKHSVAFTLLLGTLSALPPFSIDMALPALSSIGAALNATEASTQLTLSLFLTGFALAPLACGPVSDRVGRRPVLLFGCGLFAIAGIGCTVSASIGILLFWRLLQGIGAGASAVLAMAIVRDLFEGNEARARLSYVNLVRSIAPMIAPTIGAFVLARSDWRTIFATLTGGGILVLLAVIFGFKESAPQERAPLTIKTLIQNYLTVLRNPVSCGYALMNALVFGGLFAYISNSPLLMIKVFHLSTTVFGYVFALTAFGIMMGAFVNGKLSTRNVDPLKPLITGLVLATSAALINVLIHWTGYASVFTLVPGIFAYTFSMGLIAPNAAHGCLQPMPRIAGVASAVLTCTQMLMGAMSSAVVAFLYESKSAFAMTTVMLAFASAALLMYLLVIRPVELKAKVAQKPV